ncbi:uroporphyrinogen-III synthase [Conoideocrella luteorostrata]|uniref:Uroporphyrinogen-III synthase n=1 Tax=Conoideocrella luteorostrata TaxID=1105319 RepID=A0AAJ0FXV0_9HYPO|nr:uroporphyrinogen-III synthase [Conoideocrella luteorostrata]
MASSPQYKRTDSDISVKVPVLLLKTKSTPNDAYEEILSSSRFSHGAAESKLNPLFVPVLLHHFNNEGHLRVQSLLQAKQISSHREAMYGGMIFTSQRAVEAFLKVVQNGKGSDIDWSHIQNVPIYSVGPATTRALNAIPLDPPLQTFGEHTGNGEALAAYILKHYGQWYSDRDTRPPLLFLVGEQCRDIIPRVLKDKNLDIRARIHVEEVVVYGTGIMESFPHDFGTLIRETSQAPERWVVVFSPTGCDSMLQGLGLLNASTCKINLERRDGKTFIATIGPTTRAHLINHFGFEPDVCADSPSPEGILQGMLKFSSKLSK